MDVARRVLLRWRERIAEKLRTAAAHHPPRRPIDAQKLADMLGVIFEGAFVLSKTLGEPGIVAAQVAESLSDFLVERGAPFSGDAPLFTPEAMQATIRRGPASGCPIYTGGGVATPPRAVRSPVNLNRIEA